MHLAVKIEKKVLFWDDRVTDRLTREAGILWRPLNAYAIPLSPPLMSFSLSVGLPGHNTLPPSHATYLTLELPSEAVGTTEQLEFCKSATKGRLQYLWLGGIEGTDQALGTLLLLFF